MSKLLTPTKKGTKHVIRKRIQVKDLKSVPQKRQKKRVRKVVLKNQLKRVKQTTPNSNHLASNSKFLRKGEVKANNFLIIDSVSKSKRRLVKAPSKLKSTTKSKASELISIRSNLSEEEYHDECPDSPQK